MHIEREEANGAVLLRVTGRLDTPNAGLFETDLLDVVSKSAGDIVINLEAVDYISSSGLRVLLKTGKLLSGGSRRMSLMSLQPQVAEVFEISGFTAVFKIS